MSHWNDSVWPRLPPDWCGAPVGQVHCVRVFLDRLPAEAPASLRRFLTEEEIGRADRFVTTSDRARAVVGRATLRILLGRAMRCVNFLALHIEVTAHGKPFLRGGPAFNLSHGGSVILLAFTDSAPVGVDIEPETAGGAWREVSPRLHPLERAELASAADPTATFLKIWTRKEAVAKAVGSGLSMDPSLWAVSAAEPRILIPPPGVRAATPLTLFGLLPARSYIGSAAVQGIGDLRCWTFGPECHCPSS